MAIHAFPEGQTEENILKKIGKIDGEAFITCHPAKGKDNVNRKLTEIIGPKLLKSEPIRCLVLRDLDGHEGETVGTVRQSVADALRREFDRRGLHAAPMKLIRHADHDNVFTMATTDPDFRLALHIAVYKWKESFIKSTIDDYVLALALNRTTAERLADKLALDGGGLIHKIEHELPDLLARNGIRLEEAKDYVRLYAAVIKTHTSPPVFASKTMANAEDGLIRAAFSPLLAAVDFLRRADDDT